MSTVALEREAEQEALPVCLVRENPYRLVSLWDVMQPYQASLFSHLCFLLGQMHQITKVADADNGPNPASVGALKASSREVMQSCSYLGMKLSIIQLTEAEKVLDKALSDAIVNHSGGGWSFANRSIFDAAKRLKEELSSKALFALTDEGAEFLNAKKRFKGDVANTFPAVVLDEISEAGSCFAFDRWTACVFHLMRVLEHGLHHVAKNVNVQWPKPSPLELEQWMVIIDQIETRIRELEKLPKGQYKTEVLKAYSEAATEFRYFKDAWRNHVSHSRESYDYKRAKRIFESVTAFMQDVSKLPALP